MDDTVTHCDFNTRDVSLLGSNHIHGTATSHLLAHTILLKILQIDNCVWQLAVSLARLCGSCFPSVQVATKTGPLWMKAKH